MHVYYQVPFLTESTASGFLKIILPLELNIRVYNTNSMVCRWYRNIYGNVIIKGI